MRQFLLLISVLLLGLSWAVAQDSTSPATQSSTSSSPSSGAAQNSDSMGSGQTSRTGADGQVTVEGCLSGSSGNFTLTDKNGTAYQLTGDTAKLSEHVGHEVKVMGTTGSPTGAESSTGTASAGAGQTLQVSSVKHVSKTCKSTGGGMSH